MREQFYDSINLLMTRLNSFGPEYKEMKMSRNYEKMNYLRCLFYKKNKATKS